MVNFDFPRCWMGKLECLVAELVAHHPPVFPDGLYPCYRYQGKSYEDGKSAGGSGNGWWV